MMRSIWLTLRKFLKLRKVPEGLSIYGPLNLLTKVL